MVGKYFVHASYLEITLEQAFVAEITMFNDWSERLNSDLVGE